VQVSVAICTWNRAASLRRTLASVAALEIPREVRLELLVVDNGSSDETPAVLAEHAGGLPLRALVEPEPGLAGARNRAAAEACGELLLWTDDDVVVEPGWLAAFVEAARRHADAAFFGGACEPWLEQPPPDWIAASWERLADVWAIRRLDPEPAPITRERLPVGASFAIRAAVQRRYAYDPKLGRRGDALVGGEETELLRRLLADGHRGWWVPDARVRHLVPAERMSEAYLRRVWFGQGRERALTRRGGRRSRLARLARALRAEARYRVSRRLASPERWLLALERAQQRWGELSAAPR
jgi:glycosyltransferase involved in cell wall biosynthesis